MLQAGVALIGAGFFLQLYTLWPARSEQDVRRSEDAEADLRKQLGWLWFLSGQQRQFMWAKQATLRHPILMRLPGVVLIVAGLVLLLIAVM